MKTTLTLVTLYLLFSSDLSGQAGTLDPSFGTNGLVVLDGTATTANYTCFMDLVPYPQGRLLAAGRHGPGVGLDGGTHRFLAARFLADGEPDNTFGTGGQVEGMPGTSGSLNHVLNAAVLADERIVTSGYLTSGAAIPSAGVWRLLPNGDPDTTHGFLGVAAPFNSPGFSFADPRSMVLSPEGRPILLMRVQSNSNVNLRMNWLLEDGTTDNSYFGTVFNFVPEADLFGSLMLPDGAHLLYGTRLTDGGPNRAVVVRLLPGGERDLDFGTAGNGVVSWQATIRDDIAFSAATDAAGNIYLLNGGPTILKLLPNGLPDPNFGIGGVLDIALPSGFWPLGNELEYEIHMADIIAGFEPHMRHGALAVDDQGRIVIVLFNGYEGIHPTAHHVLRLLPDGSPDTGFGANGIADLPLTSTQTHIQRVLTTPDRILVAGSVKQPGSNSRMNAMLMAIRPTSGTGLAGPHADARITCSPNPVRAGEPVWLSGLPQGATVELRDAAGRLVHGPVRITGAVEAPTVVQLPGDLSPGVYMLYGGPPGTAPSMTTRLVVVGG